MGALQAVRGMNDILPGDSEIWQSVEATLRRVFNAYSYREIRLPLIERTELFARSIGDATDIVAKEMYTFDDRNGESLSLRPEGTASCARAGLQHGLFFNQWQRLWYMGPMFRHERPQRGRNRQFYQAGAEAFGWNGPDIDAELIALSARFWDATKLESIPRLEINSLGDLESRARYRSLLVDYLSKFEKELDADSQKRLNTNPLRILDSKDAGTQEILEGAPSIHDCLDIESRDHFEGLCGLLQGLGIDYTINQRLVRGLDYYSHTVFEWITEKLGAQSAVCAGGRYDGLVQQLGGKRPVPGAGFALGIDRLVELVMLNSDQETKFAPEVFVVMAGEDARDCGWRYSEQLRDRGYSVQMFCGTASLKNQMKRADKSGARITMILGENEIESDSVTLKSMYENDFQVTVSSADLFENIERMIRDKSDGRTSFQ